MVCNCLKRLDSGFRRNDGKENFSTFYEFINIDSIKNNMINKNIMQNQGNLNPARKRDCGHAFGRYLMQRYIS